MRRQFAQKRIGTLPFPRIVIGRRPIAGFASAGCPQAARSCRRPGDAHRQDRSRRNARSWLRMSRRRFDTGWPRKRQTKQGGICEDQHRKARRKRISLPGHYAWTASAVSIKRRARVDVGRIELGIQVTSDPSRPIRYLLKFQVTARPDCASAHLKNGFARSPTT